MFYKTKRIIVPVISIIGAISCLICTSVFAQTWRELGPCGSDTYGNAEAGQGGTGQIHSIAFDPDNAQIVYCGSPYGGLWRSTDGGKSWSNSEIDIHQTLDPNLSKTKNCYVPKNPRDCSSYY